MRSLLMVLLIFGSCKSKQGLVEDVGTKDGVAMEYCVLSKLPKTVNYIDEIKILKEIYQDTIVPLENCEVDNVRYTLVFDLKQSSHFLWLIRNFNTVKADSILIECLEETRSVESYFDLEHCTIEKMITEFHENGDPKRGFTKVVKLGE